MCIAGAQGGPPACSLGPRGVQDRCASHLEQRIGLRPGGAVFSCALPVFSNRTYLGTGCRAPVHTALSLDFADERRGDNPLFQKNPKGDHLCGVGLQPGADTCPQRGRAPRNLSPVSGWSSDTLVQPLPPGSEASGVLCERRPCPVSLLTVTDAPHAAPQNFTHLEKLGGSQNYRVKSRFSTAS